MIYSPIFHPASKNWFVGIIESHIARPLTEEEVDAVCKRLNNPEKPRNRQNVIFYKAEDACHCPFCGKPLPYTADHYVVPLKQCGASEAQNQCPVCLAVFIGRRDDEEITLLKP